MALEWNDTLSMGHEKIDEEHKHLVGMLNDAMAKQGMNAGSLAIGELINDLTVYAGQHFTTEEDYMTELAFPGLAEHQTEHKQFKEKVASFCVSSMSNKETLAGEILQFLSDWLVNHLMTVDMKYKEFAESQRSIS